MNGLQKSTMSLLKNETTVSVCGEPLCEIGGAQGSSEKQQTSMSNGSSEKQKRKISTSTRRPPSSRGKGGAGGANISQGSSAGRQRKGVCVAKNFWYGPLDNRIDTGGHDDGLFVTLWTKPLKQCYD